jgi:hypothetical protein
MWSNDAGIDSAYFLQALEVRWLTLCIEVNSVTCYVVLVIALRPKTPKHIRGGWSHYTDTSERVDGNGAQNMVTVPTGFRIRDILITVPTRLPTALTGLYVAWNRVILLIKSEVYKLQAHLTVTEVLKVFCFARSDGLCGGGWDRPPSSLVLHVVRWLTARFVWDE